MWITQKATVTCFLCIFTVSGTDANVLKIHISLNANSNKLYLVFYTCMCACTCMSVHMGWVYIWVCKCVEWVSGIHLGMQVCGGQMCGVCFAFWGRLTHRNCISLPWGSSCFCTPSTGITGTYGSPAWQFFWHRYWGLHWTEPSPQPPSALYWLHLIIHIDDHSMFVSLCRFTLFFIGDWMQRCTFPVVYW